MKIEIWSDVMCPFCYIGKRRFEKALEQFEHKDKVRIEWKSFQLNPNLKTQPDKNATEHLAEAKGWSMEQTLSAQDHVVSMAKQEGLEFNFDKAVVANSFNAHRFTHLAKSMGLQDIVEEHLFQAYFTEGKNIDDPQTLKSIGTLAGIPEDKMDYLIHGNAFADEVEKDLYEARQFGIQGVPYFVFDGKYGISGAQETSTFLNALKQIAQKENLNA